MHCGLGYGTWIFLHHSYPIRRCLLQVRRQCLPPCAGVHNNAQHSVHSTTWSMTSASPCMWPMHEVVNCLACKRDGEEVMTIV